MKKHLTTLLLTLLVSGGLWAQNPEEALYKYFELFNSADKDAINNASDSPFIFFIGTNKTVSENYGDSVDFEGLRQQGWAYSKINKRLEAIKKFEEAIRLNETFPEAYFTIRIILYP